MNPAEDLSIVEIADLNDDLLLPWLDLYETAFPPSEKILISSYLKLLRDKAAGRAQDHHLLAGLDPAGTLAAIAYYQVLREPPVAILWYLAVKPEARGAGIGSRLYREILRRLEPGDTQALLLEVEIPENGMTEEDRRNAQRRIAFYRRLGARLLRGVRYLQYVGWHQVPVPMHVMLHLLRPLSDATAYQLAKAVAGEWLTPVGTPHLE